jgi:hypothetical protein
MCAANMMEDGAPGRPQYEGGKMGNYLKNLPLYSVLLTIAKIV